MVFLGLEKPVEYGSRQIFDPTMANMVLNAQQNYINAVKDDYLRGREDIKEFNKNFGDFFSPIQKDMEWYDQNVTGATRDLINNLYAQGIDPLRSVEGRSLISRWVNNMPVGKINQLKQSAAAANEYLDNLGKLEAAGKYSKDFEDFVTGGMSLDNWDTANNGMWTRRSPAEMKTLKELTESWYNNRTAGLLTPDEIAEFGMKYDPRYDYYGFSRKSLADIAAGQTPGWNDSIHSQYYREVAKRQLQRAGVENPNQDQIEAQLQANIAQANEEYLIRPEMKANQYALADYENKLAMQRDAINNAAKAARSGSRGAGGSDDRVYYDTATDLYDSSLNNIAGMPSGSMYTMKDANGNIVYYPAERYYQGTNDLTSIQDKFGADVLKQTDKNDLERRIQMYKNRWIHQKGLSGSTIANLIGKELYTSTTNNKHDWKGMNVMRLDASDVNRIGTVVELVTNTQGYRGVHKKYIDNDEKKLIEKIKSNPNQYLIGGTNISVYGAYNKPGQLRNDAIMDVYDASSGKKVGQITYNTNINSEFTEGGLYLKDDYDTDSKTLKKNRTIPSANSVRQSNTRMSVTAGSTTANKDDYGLTRYHENQSEIYPASQM